MSYLGPSLRRRRKRVGPLKRVAVAVAVSLLANAAFLRFVRVGLAPLPDRTAPQRPVVLAPLTVEQWEQNRRATATLSGRPATPAVTPQPPRPQEPKPPEKMKGQVVDVAPSKDQTPPKDSRFLAEHDSTVEKETRSRHARPGYENTLPTPSSPRPAPPAQPARPQPADNAVAAGERGREGVKRPGAPPRQQNPAAGALTVPDRGEDRRLALKLDREGDLRLRDPREGVRGPGTVPSPGPAPEPSQPPGEQGQPAVPGKPGSAISDLRLRPSASVYDRLAGGPAPDRLDGVEEGDGTYLNTRGWKYAGYFNRISQAVRGQWDPNSAMRTRDPTGSRFGDRDWFTLLVVKLDDRGALKDVVVERSSGLDFLDAAAIQALRRAQPFVNPPRGLADERGEIVFSYGFTLQGSFGLERIFRRGPAE